MKNSKFLALILRMKHIDRWGLMRSTFSDNLAEHSFDTAVIAHCLCTVGNVCFGKSLDADRCAVLALYHDATEILTGDMPTPVKYYSQSLRQLYGQVEKEAASQMIRRLPQELQPVYREIFDAAEEDEALRPYLKAADRLSALIKCLQEEQGGNREYVSARIAQQQALEQTDLPEVRYFMTHFLPAFTQELDRQLTTIGEED